MVKGDAAVTSSSDSLQVHANGKAIIQWDKFDIGSHETARFIQAHSKDAVLNRVVKGSTSQILGMLQANCPLYLINPQGVFIGSAAQIETAGFLASTADISNEAFWQGSPLEFTNFGDGGIVNLGTLTSTEGDVIFIARSINNTGNITASQGMIRFSTQEVVIHPETKQVVYIRLDNQGTQQIDNSGKLQALAVEFKTNSPYEKAIHHTGTIEALATREINGHIYLVAERGGTTVDGTLIAKSGHVHLLGETVSLQEHTHIDVSGPQGGTILVGGDYKGSNPDVQNAKKTTVALGATLVADGTAGDGGRVIVWGDDLTSYWGNISCQALGESGDGGFVEISAKSNHHEFKGPVNTLSVNGKTGMLLLDPVDITVNNFAGTSTPAFPTTPPGTYAPTAVASANLDVTNVQTALATTNVTIDATTGTGGATTGNINFILGPTWSANTTLIANAARTITVSGTISATGAGAVNFTAQGLGGTATGQGIYVSPTGLIQTDSGNITLNGTGITVAGAGQDSCDGILVDGQVITNSGTIALTGQGGDLGNGSGDGIVVRGLVNSVISGTISLQGTAGTAAGGAGSGNNGSIIRAGGIVRSSGSGDINITGTSAAIGLLGTGIELAADGTTATCEALGSGNIMFNGLITGGAATNSTGIEVGVRCTVSSQSGTITMRGRNNGTGPGSRGIQIDSTSMALAVIQSNSGNILLDSIVTAGNSSSASILVGGHVQSTSGNITFSGIHSSPIGAFQIGILLLSPAVVSTVDGNIQCTGVAGGQAAGASDVGIFFDNSTLMQTTGLGTITLMGTGGLGTSNTQGIAFLGNGIISSNQGNISLTGTGGGTGNGDGIAVTSGGTITAANNGTITLNGTASNIGITGNNGVLVSGTLSAITSAAGNINITAIGKGAGANNRGLTVSSAGNISTTSGTINVLSATGSPNGTTGGHGIYVTGANSKISAVNGALNLTGTGQGSGATNQGIRVETSGSVRSTGSAAMALTGTGSSTGTASNEGIFITGTTTTVNSVNGPIQMTGTAGKGTTNGITVDSSATVVTTTSGNLTANSPHRLTVQNNGSIRTLGVGGIALTTGGISLTTGATGGAQISTVNGNIGVNSTGSVVLTAGAVVNAAAQIATGQGNIVVSTSDNITMTGGSANGAAALIRSTTQGALTLNANNLIVQGGSATAQAGVVTQSGDINVTCVQDCQYSAPLATAPALMQTFGSDLTVIAGGSINLTGFTTISTPAPTGNLLLIAGQNISIGSTSQVIASGTVNSSLRLVVDNQFPTAPGIGPGQFILAAGGVVSAGAGTPVRIYTARRTQNGISSPINGAFFSPGPFAVDSSTEQWTTYFPGGTYGGAFFKIYYKEPQPIPQSKLFQFVAANLVQLADLLPVLKAPRYHFQICEEDRQWKYCAPTFSPYGSFIFEDDVYWIGTQF